MGTSIAMRSADFKSVVEPILNQVFDGVYDQRKDEWADLFTVEQGLARSFHEDSVLFNFGAAPEIRDGQPVTYTSGGELFRKRYTYQVYGLAYALTKILVEDGEHVRLGSIFAKALAQALVETKETKCANELNRAFNGSYVGGDGQSLISASHPIVGGVASNVLATSAALSQTSLEQMLIQIRNATDNNGKKIRLNAMKLVISTANIFQAEVLLKSVLRSGTNNNDINAVKSMGILSSDQAVAISRLTSPTAWFIKTDEREGLKVLMRRAMEKSMEGDFETDSIRYKATERYATGWTNWRCMFGTPGT